MSNPANRFDPTGHDCEWSTFWNGLFMIGTAVSAIALSIVTFGAATPLAMTIIAGVTLGAGDGWNYPHLVFEYDFDSNTLEYKLLAFPFD